MVKKIIFFFSSKLANILLPIFCYVCKQEGDALCASCLIKIPRAYTTPSPSIISIYSFKDRNIKRIVHAIKYFHRKDLIRPIAQVLIGELRKKNLTSQVLIPIPMPFLRKYMRGYNHSETLALEISHTTGLLMRNDILKRSSYKKRQVITTSRQERLKNQHNAFSIKRNVQGMSIILVDDVTTTGATLLEARKKLLESGAASVEAITIAH